MNKRILLILVVLSLIIVCSKTDAVFEILTFDRFRTQTPHYLMSGQMAIARQLLLDAGFSVRETSYVGPLTYNAPAVFYTGLLSERLNSSEVDNLVAFVNAGGGLVIQREWGDYGSDVDHLASRFGASFNPGPFGGGGYAHPVNKTKDHLIWDGPAGSVTTYDQVGSCSVIGVTGIGEHGSDPGEVGLAITTYGEGRVVFLTDVNAWDDWVDDVTPYPGTNNAIVWENMFLWAAGVPEPCVMVIAATSTAALLCWRRRRA